MNDEHSNCWILLGHYNQPLMIPSFINYAKLFQFCHIIEPFITRKGKHSITLKLLRAVKKVDHNINVEKCIVSRVIKGSIQEAFLFCVRMVEGIKSCNYRNWEASIRSRTLLLRYTEFVRWMTVLFPFVAHVSKQFFPALLYFKVRPIYQPKLRSSSSTLS